MREHEMAMRRLGGAKCADSLDVEKVSCGKMRGRLFPKFGAIFAALLFAI